MKKHLVPALVVALALSGCASSQMNDLNAWAATALPQAKAGDIKWSDYYKTLFDKLSAIPSHPDKGIYMQMSSAMIKVSQDYEAGQLTKDQFDEAQRAAISQSATIEGQRSAQSRAYWAAALLKAGSDMSQNSQNYYRQQQQTVPTYKPPVVCESRAVNGSIQTVCR